jgi:hypothetical protein
VDESLGIGERQAEDLDRRPDAVDLREPLAVEGLQDLVPAGTLVPHLGRSVGDFADHLESSVRSMLISRARHGHDHDHDDRSG